MKNNQIFLIVVLTGLGNIFSGCSHLQVDGVKTGKILLTPADEIKVKGEAVESLQALRDKRNFPSMDIEDVEVGEFGITLRGAVRMAGTIGSHSSSEYRDNFFGGVRGQSTAIGQFNQETSRYNLLIWFKDIRRIKIELKSLFSTDQKNGAAYLTASYFDCEVTSEGQTPVVFLAVTEGAVKRVANALSYFSKVPVDTKMDYPPSGVVLDPENNVATWVLVGGPFDRANIPVLSQILAIDGVKESKNGHLASTVQYMSSGTHKILYRAPGFSRREEKEIVIKEKDVFEKAPALP